MPIPKRQPSEKRKDFMTRCISDPTMIKEYPDQEQRIAVCITQFEK